MLRDDQSAIRRALLDDGIAPPCLIGSQARALRRFGVHRRNVRASLVGTLAAAFPATRVLLGEAVFARCAAAFVQAHPPRRPELFAYGDGFPAFLTACPSGAPEPRAPALAAFEWLRQLAYFSEDAPSLAIEAIRAVPETEYPYLRFRLHPSARLAVFHVPVLALWRACLAGPPDTDDGVDGEALMPVLVMRPRMDVCVAELTQGAAALLKALARHATLIEAADAALEADASFDVRDALAEHLGLGTFAGFSRPTRTAMSGAAVGDH